MQTCWDGVSLYKSDQSHVAYLSRMDNGVCPPTHPVLLPHLFYEVLYSVDQIDTSAGGKYMLAMATTPASAFTEISSTAGTMNSLQMQLRTA